MKRRRAISVAFIALVVVLVIIVVILQTMKKNQNETKNADGAILVKRSVAQGDYVVDTRKPEDACATLLKEVQKAHPGKICRLIESTSVGGAGDSTDHITQECVDGASVAGCFACKFECK